jgi:HicB family
MARRPNETVQINLRLKESLRRKLEREALKHGISLNIEMRVRLEDSFKAQAMHNLEDVANDLKINWRRWAQRFLLLELQEDLAEAMSRSKDPEVAKAAQVWLLTKRSWPPRGQGGHNDEG